MHKKALASAVILGLASTSAVAGVTYKDGDSYMKLGGRMQLQYYQASPDAGPTTDNVFFRRFRPYIEGSTNKDWKGKFQWDMGKAVGDNEISIKDAYMQYKGAGNMKVTIGNYSFPFSREFLTSSKYQQLVERTFVGDSNYGTPDRQAGIYVHGNSEDKRMNWALALADGRVDPDAKKLDFETAVNDAADYNQGMMVGARVDFHPLGNLKMSQGDFDGKTKATISLAAFNWKNDNDNNIYTKAGADTSGGTKPDVDSITALEISGAYRHKGISVDAEYNVFNADTIDNTVTSGIYKNGTTDLSNYAIEGGYMLLPNKLELVVGYSSQDADGYASTWNRTEVGANWFVAKHDIKYQLTYRQNDNKDGVQNSNEDELFAQAQYVF